MDLTLLTCNYDTPTITTNMVKSYLKTSKFSKHDILIMDTSPMNGNLPESPNYNIVDIPTAAHGEAVNYALKLIKTRYVLLVDSDIIFLKDISPIAIPMIEGGYALMGKVSGDRGGKKLKSRVDPWFCLMDLQQLNDKGIKFFDPIRTKNSRNSGGEIYDVGSTLFEDVTSADLFVGDMDIEGKYFKHYEGMSWRVGKYDPSQGDTDIDFGGTHNNKALYDYGIIIENQYMHDTLDL